MKKVRELRKKYVITWNGKRIGLMSMGKGSSSKDSLLNEVRENFETKLLEVASELERRQVERLDKVQKFSAVILTEAQKLNDDKMIDEFSEFMEELSDLEERVDETIDSMNEERVQMRDEIKEMLLESLSEECSFLNRASDVCMKNGDAARACELREFMRKLLNNATTVMGEIMHQYEEAIHTICAEMWDVIEAKNENLENFLDFLREKTGELLEEELGDGADKTDANAPKTHNELKKYLESNGFEIDRHNGSHQIYKNAKSGEVRVLPSRRGAHVLAPKTRKKIIEGVSNL